jgi:hypothetical protein
MIWLLDAPSQHHVIPYFVYNSSTCVGMLLLRRTYPVIEMSLHGVLLNFLQNPQMVDMQVWGFSQLGRRTGSATRLVSGFGNGASKHVMSIRRKFDGNRNFIS